ncbi:MAG: YraN family protein [Bryobacteraceae bacterium]
MLNWFYALADRARQRARSRRWKAEQATGRMGEDLAHRHLSRAGMIVVARNYRTRSGRAEVDLIAWDSDILVFVEVKTRQNEDFGAPDRAIGEEKERALCRAAREYSGRIDVPWERVRFDVVNVVLAGTPVVTHLRNALRPDPKTTASQRPHPAF